MDFLVFLDANVVLARCLGPALDAKSEAAEEALKFLEDRGIHPVITSSIHREVEAKVRDRVGQVLDEVRRLAGRPMPVPKEGETTFEALERVAAELRREAPESAGAIQLLESRLARDLGDSVLTTDEQWRGLLERIALETTALLAEVQRRKDTLSLAVEPTPAKTDADRFRGVVPASDLEHLASLCAIAERRKIPALFVTMDAKLHASREDIAKVCPNVIVTMPAYLSRRVERLLGDA